MKNFYHPRRWAWTQAAAIAVLALFGCIAVFAQDDDPPPQAGRLAALSGTVSIQPAGTEDWGQAYANLPLGPGDRIVTDQDGRAEIQVERAWVRIGPNSDVTLVDATDDALTFGVAQGSAIAHVHGLWPNQNVYMQTPSGTITITDLSDVRVDVMAADQTAVFSDRWGSSLVSGAGDFSQQLAEGQALELAGTNPVTPQWLSPLGKDSLDLWNDERSAMMGRSTSARYVSDAIPGVSELDASGEWAPESDYGPVWYPRVDAGWAPYRNGHWANRDPWGWIWVEDESWGYAPFHFGRWVTINGRWGWIPGPREARPVWSPALVVFAGGQPGMSAWIPLGPGEPYKPWYHCSPRYIDAINVSNIHPGPRVVVQRTYVNITNVNITYVNRTSVTVVRQDDFNSGHSVAKAAVHVDPVQFSAHVNVVVAPPAPAKRPSIVSAPAARPAHVAAARPVMINAKGQTVAAQAHAQPVATPVKAVAAPKPVAGRTVVAPPPNAKAQPHQPAAAPRGNEPAAAAHPAQPKQEPSREPAAKPATEPKANQQPEPKAQRPGAPAETQPKPAQKPAPEPKANQEATPKPKPQTPAQAKPEAKPQTQQEKDKQKEEDKKKKQPPPPPPSA